MTLLGEQLNIYALIKMLKHFTGSSVKSYMIKFALNMTTLGNHHSKSDDLGFKIRRVLSHWTIKEEFSSVHPELRALGIFQVKVGDTGIFFLREKSDRSAEEESTKEAEKEKERGNCEYRQRNHARAMVHYQRALDIDPTKMTFWGNLTAVLFETRAFKEVSS